MLVQESARVLVVICLLLSAMAGVAQAQSPNAGRVKAAVGSATIVRQGQSSPARVGDPVLAFDVLRTGADGQLAVMLKDDTRISLGASSEVALSTFEFAPAEGRLSLVLRMARGAMSYASGQIAKLMPAAVRLETPTSVIGVRGTHALIRVDAP
jgi:hypothetical protein